jgi:hypothetical protein
LFTGGCEDDPDFSGANPTVYTNLWLQIKSKLLAGETGSEPPRCIYFAAIFRTPLLTPESLLPHHGCGHRGDRPAVFASRLEDVGNIRSVARVISHPLFLFLVLVLVIVLVLERKTESSTSRSTSTITMGAACRNARS